VSRIGSILLKNDIEIGKRIGRGACSDVYFARNLRTSEPYALKMFNINDRSRRSQLLKEIKILATLSCDALITFHGAFLKEGNIGVILEFMDKGSIEFLMNPRLQITEVLVAGIAFQVTLILS
jgi:serine/threonine protein kinase